jgi:S1-C subfamily serine protease
MTNDSSRSSLLPGFVAGIVGALVVQTLWVRLPSLPTTPSTPGEPIVVETPRGEAPSVETVVERVNPAVVSVIVSKDVPVYESYTESIPSPFSPFFGGGNSFVIPRQRQNGTKEQEVGGGSGFLISADGSIVTNNHVVADDAAKYKVVRSDGTEYAATVVAKDAVLDVAVLKIEAKDLPFLAFGDSDALKAGQTVVAIGNPLNEFRNTVSVGVVSGLARRITAGSAQGTEQLEGLIQTDAAINPGNSGGPLLNLKGEVIGVNVAVAGGAENIGFALAANQVKTAVDSILKNGRVVRPYVGVRYLAVNKQVQEKYQLPVNQGAYVFSGSDAPAVLPNSPAQKAGIRVGDIITQVNGDTLDENHSLANRIRGAAVGDIITLTVRRGEETLQVKLTLEELPKP